MGESFMGASLILEIQTTGALTCRCSIMARFPKLKTKKFVAVNFRAIGVRWSIDLAGDALGRRREGQDKGRKQTTSFALALPIRGRSSRFAGSPDLSIGGCSHLWRG